MAKHSLGVIVALSSDIASRVCVIFISMVPMTVLICSAGSSNPPSPRSATGGAVVVFVVDVVDNLVL